MTQQSDSSQRYWDQAGLRSVNNLTRALNKGVVSPKEYFDNVLESLIHLSDECWAECLEIVPSEYAGAFFEWCGPFLKNCDFMPGMGLRFSDYGDPKAAELRKRELRPRFMKALEAIKARADACRQDDAATPR